MIKLENSIQAWSTPEFKSVFKQEVQQLRPSDLPLQGQLSQTSYLSDSEFTVIVQSVSDEENTISVKAGLFFSGIISGSCCADDPTPVDEQTEYCELLFNINKQTGDTIIE